MARRPGNAKRSRPKPDAGTPPAAGDADPAGTDPSDGEADPAGTVHTEGRADSGDSSRPDGEAGVTGSGGVISSGGVTGPAREDGAGRDEGRMGDVLEAEGLLDRIRAAGARVASLAGLVRIDEEALDRLAEALAPEAPPLLPEERPVGTDGEEVAAQVVAWNAVNFGSGWFPELRKRPGLSGARALAAALADHVAAHGAPSAAWLAEADVPVCAEVFGQAHPGPVDDLLELFARAWRDLGTLLLDRFDASAATLVHSAEGSAERLAATLATMPLARDVAIYQGEPVPLLKRAQITASHLAQATSGTGVGRFHDLGRLTAFADNLVPHTLRTMGVLRYDDVLAGRIERGELLEPGEPAEVEIRACGLHAVELLAERTGRLPATIDHQLWQRGQSPDVKAVPRHRCRCPWY